MTQEFKCPNHNGKNCDWKGNIDECKVISDRGFLGSVWWYKSWNCPKCGSKVAEVNQNTPSDHPLFYH